MTRLRPALFLWLPAFLLGAAAVQEPEEGPGAADLEIAFLANEGFLLTWADKQVVIDGLFGDGIAGYGAVPEALRDKVESAAPPFEEVDLVLVSHRHADHFAPQAVAEHLEHNPEARLISSEEVVTAVRRVLGPERSAKQTVSVALDYGDPPAKREHDGIAVEMIRVSHGQGRREIQNLGQIVELGEWRVAHFGDMSISSSQMEEFAAYRFHEKDIDIAFVPYWYLLEERHVPMVGRLLNARTVVAMHVRPDELAEVRKKTRALHPEVIFFEAALDTRRFAGDS